MTVDPSCGMGAWAATATSVRNTQNVRPGGRTDAFCLLSMHRTLHRTAPCEPEHPTRGSADAYVDPETPS